LRSSAPSAARYAVVREAVAAVEHLLACRDPGQQRLRPETPALRDWSRAVRDVHVHTIA